MSSFRKGGGAIVNAAKIGANTSFHTIQTLLGCKQNRQTAPNYRLRISSSPSHPMNSSQLTQTIKSEAGRQGFDWVGVTQAARPAGFENLKNWIDEGFAGEMNYLADRLPAYRHPDSILDGAQSVVMLALNYFIRRFLSRSRTAKVIQNFIN